MATEIITALDQICDSGGTPLSGAKVYVYDVGTTTLKSLWSDTALSVSAANPIVCDSAGRHDMRYIATGSYKLVVKNSSDVTQYTRDNIDGGVPVGSGALAIANGGTGATTAEAAIAALGGATSAEVAEVAADVAALAGTLASTEATHLATGTTAQRAAAPIAGDVRHNTTLGKFEGYIAAWWSFLTTQDLATASIMETATSTTTLVTPAIVQNHPGVAKAWALVTVSGGTPTLTANYNIASITDAGVGNYVLLIDTNMSSANYAVIATAFEESGTTGTSSFEIVCTDRATTSFRIRTFILDGSAARVANDCSFHVALFGDQ